MSFEFLDRIAASRRKPRPIFKAFRSRLVMNGDARRLYFPGTDRVLLGYDRETRRLAIKAIPPEAQEHEGWQAFHIEPQPKVHDSYQLPWREFWDREIGKAIGRPAIHGEEAVQRLGDDVIVLDLL